MKFRSAFFLASFLLFSLGCQQSNQQVEGLSAFVDPFIGTGGHGHTYPGATVPFGMLQLSPDTRLTGWDGCSGYHFSDSHIYGFSHTHLSGTGIPDYGDVLLMPTTGELRLHNGADGEPGYRSAFRKETEIATPGYYEVLLDDYQVKVSLTASERAGFHRYDFQQQELANVILDLVHRDHVISAGLKVVSDTEIEGFRISKDWAEHQEVFFVAQFSKPIKDIQLADGIQKDPREKFISARNIKAGFQFDVSDGEPLLVKVGISAVDMAGARKNLEKEIPDWDFEKTKMQAHEKWEQQLGKIEIEGLDEAVMTNFYTALYHTSIVPNLFHDVDGRYRGMDRKVYQLEEGEQQYTVFSLWDTYRATHPLFTIIEQQRTRDFIRTFLRQYEQGGKLPMWELAANYTGCMIGYHSVSVIADAYMKGIRDFDVEKAMEAMIATATADELGKTAYGEFHYIPSNKEHESVSKTLEYAYNDWCIAQMGKALGQDSTYERFMERAQYYKNVFNPEVGFMAAKRNHSWVEPFDPAEVNYHFTEANSWQYSFYVPQDVSGLVALHGGEAQLEAKLDELFTTSPQTTGREQPDITGLIGQYAHGNEPSHHMAYLYNYLGKPWKTQERVRQILEELYQPAPDGLSGNEDCGQMSAWYVLSALGFYAVTPGSTYYVIGSPLVKTAVINLENGKTFTIKANGLSKTAKYIQSAQLNGQPYPKSYLEHAVMMEGGTLVFEMGTSPNENWATDPADRPVSEIKEPYLPVPYFSGVKQAFLGKDTLLLGCAETRASIQFQLNAAPTQVYQTAIELTDNTEISAFASYEGENTPLQSQAILTTFKKIPEGRTLQLKYPYSNQYAAGGDLALIDYLTGGDDYRTGEWQGFQGVDLDAVIGLDKKEPVKRVTVRFLQDENSWIFMPLEVQFYYSKDGTTFEMGPVVKNTISPRNQGTIVHGFTAEIGKRVQAIRVVAKNRGECPPYHKGAGGKAWIFADEIYVQ